MPKPESDAKLVQRLSTLKTDPKVMADGLSPKLEAGYLPPGWKRTDPFIVDFHEKESVFLAFVQYKGDDPKVSVRAILLPKRPGMMEKLEEWCDWMSQDRK